jgi:dehydrogenase/reductase SDR family protein 7
LLFLFTFEEEGKLNDNDVLVLPFDIANEKDQDEGWKKIVEQFGNIDILVNNAGRIYFSHFDEDTMDKDLKLFTINTFANINLSRLVVRHWKATNTKGLIVVTSSLAAYIPLPLMHVYNASKRALIVSGLTLKSMITAQSNLIFEPLQEYYNSVRIGLAGTGIDVTMICPGPVNSELYQKSLLGEEKKRDEPMELQTMSTSRCVELMLAAMAYRLKEVWISHNPALLVNYMSCYAPFLTRNVFQCIMFDWVKRAFEKQVFKSK